MKEYVEGKQHYVTKYQLREFLFIYNLIVTGYRDNGTKYAT